MTRALAVLALIAALPAQALTDRTGPYELQVLVNGAPVRTFRHAGETFVLGQLGDRYTLRVVNHSGRRVEAVVSVDGRDVIDGKPADHRTKRGYLVPAWGSADIDGWRISRQEAAAFRFSTVADSYAGRAGAAREVGVIGVAVFAERRQPPPPPPTVYAPEAPWSGPRDSGERQRSLDAPPPSAMEEARPAPFAGKSKTMQRPGLGTEYGEAVPSQLGEVSFERARQQPQALLGARYDDRDGLVALGIDVDGSAPRESELRLSAEPFPVIERGYATPPPGWRR